jgi:hypothetical protein
MSGAVLPALGLNGSTSYGWVAIHKIASVLTLVLLAVKLALHRTWIAMVVKRLFARKTKQALAEPQGLVYDQATALDSKRQ